MIHFKRGSWLNLPAKISPVSLASHGWSVHNENTVKCEECNAFLSVKVETCCPGDFDEQKHAIKFAFFYPLTVIPYPFLDTF